MEDAKGNTTAEGEHTENATANRETVCTLTPIRRACPLDVFSARRRNPPRAHGWFTTAASRPPT
jgi:hypothetical protein